MKGSFHLTTTKSQMLTKRVESQETLDHVLVEKLGYVAEYYGKVCVRHVYLLTM